MGWKLKKREDVEPLLPLHRCFCFDNRMGTFIGCIIILITAFVELVTVVLDWISFDENVHFEIQGSFPSMWKRLFWKGFVICDGIMTLAHCIILALAALTLVAILRPAQFKIYTLRPILRVFYTCLIIYILIELGISAYIYSWYGLAGWRLPFLIWKNLFVIMRFICNVGFCIVAYSHCCEIDAELTTPADEFSDYEASGGVGSTEPLALAQPQTLQQQQQQHVASLNGSAAAAGYVNHGNRLMAIT